MTGVQVSIDPELCYGSWECVHRVPSVFAVVDGFGTVLPGHEDDGDDPAVRAAAEACPSRAIALGGADPRL
ncbi:ferredoxin [Streptomyces sp. NPDC090306]|uniref:ferredoxin n=1 Tax=Streptomyces sp. NPDC090306 TaxID=3365961 RepID=UPI00382A2480